MKRNSPASWTIELSDPAAKRVKKRLESLCPDAGEPLDYLDCLLFGLWRRVDASVRIVPRHATLLLDAWVNARAARSLRERSPERWVDEAEVGELLSGLFILHLIANFGRAQDEERLEEESLAGEGLTLALLTPRAYYAGDRLLTLMQRAQTAANSG